MCRRQCPKRGGVKWRLTKLALRSNLNVVAALFLHDRLSYQKRNHCDRDHDQPWRAVNRFDDVVSRTRGAMARVSPSRCAGEEAEDQNYDGLGREFHSNRSIEISANGMTIERF